MAAHAPRDPDFAGRVRRSFERQSVMHTIGARLCDVAPGLVEIELPYHDNLCQQHGFLHAGITTTILDSACGYAALSLMAAGTGVLSVEFKLNLLAPAVGELFIARGRVVRAGRTLIVCSGEVVSRSGASERSIALMQATMMVVANRPGVID
jgi:uncharacterized protein (TIGR00369 family)